MTDERLILDAHLGCDTTPTSLQHENARFMNGMRQRFLCENMFSQAHGHQGWQRVHVIGSGDGDRINVLALVKQLSPVLVPPGFRPFLRCFRISTLANRYPGQDVTKCDQVMPLGSGIDVRPTSSPNSNGCNVQLFTRRLRTDDPRRSER